MGIVHKKPDEVMQQTTKMPKQTGNKQSLDQLDLDLDLELLDLDGDGLWDREDCAVPVAAGLSVRFGLKSAVDIRSFLLAPGNNSAFLVAILALALASLRALLNSVCS